MSEAKKRFSDRHYYVYSGHYSLPRTPLYCFVDSARPECQCKQEDVIQGWCPVCSAIGIACRAQHNHGIVQDRGVKTGEPQDEKILATPRGELRIAWGHGLVVPTVSLYLQKKKT